MATSIVLSQTALVLERDDFVRLTATVLPENAANKAVTWSSSNESVAEVTSTGGVAAVGLGTCTITCTAQDGSGVVATCMAQIVEDKNNYGVQDGHIYVDLGLPTGTLWATMNIGATSPEDYGDYFAWGETETKTDYSWSSYTYGTESNLTKYNATDGKTTLEPTDDAAAVNWGNGWRMPTDAEWQELLNFTNYTWTTQNGVNGLLFIGSNDNSLFLPAAGYREGSSLGWVGGNGIYWSSSLTMYYTQDAGCFFLSEFTNLLDGNERFYGYSVRPVHSRQN